MKFGCLLQINMPWWLCIIRALNGLWKCSIATWLNRQPPHTIDELIEFSSLFSQPQYYQCRLTKWPYAGLNKKERTYTIVLRPRKGERKRGGFYKSGRVPSNVAGRESITRGEKKKDPSNNRTCGRRNASSSISKGQQWDSGPSVSMAMLDGRRQRPDEWDRRSFFFFNVLS